MSQRNPFEKFKSKTPASMSGVIATVTFFALYTYIAFYQHPIIAWYNDTPIILSLQQLIHYLKSSQLDIIKQIGWVEYLTKPNHLINQLSYDIHRVNINDQLSIRVIPLLIGMFGCFLTAYYLRYKYTYSSDSLSHIKGTKRLEGKCTAKTFTKNEFRNQRREKKNISVAPKAYLTDTSLLQHLAAFGTTGSGKSQVASYILSQILGKKKIILHDSKGDVTAQLPVDKYILLAPHDARSNIIDISTDCVGLPSAQQLAATIITDKNTSESTWIEGARAILTGLIRTLQLQKTNWNWEDLNNIIFEDPVKIKPLLEQYYPEASVYIEENETGSINKTTFSFFVGLWAAASKTISPLAKAWSPDDPRKLISLTKWLQDDDDLRPIILQRAAQFPEFSANWIATAINIISNFAASSAFPNHAEPRVWMILDEFGQIGKVKVKQILDVGREKGIVCFLGLLDADNIAHIYGKEALSSWLNLLNTKIICRMPKGPTSDYILKNIIKDRRVSWIEMSTSYNNESTPSNSFSERIGTEPAVDPEELEDIGLIKWEGQKVIRAFIVKHGNAYQFDWPLTIWPDIRPSSVPAEWTKN